MEEQPKPPNELETLVSKVQRLRDALQTTKEEQARIATQIEALKQKLADSKTDGGNPPTPAP